MKKLYILILMLIIGLISEAQPQYWNAQPIGGGNVFPFGTNPATGKKVQWIITPAGSSGGFNLPAPVPSGNNITGLWFWANSAGNATYTNLTIRMATVPVTQFFSTGAFYTGPMTIVRQQNTTVAPAGAATWVDIPLTTPFAYDPTQNLIIEVYQCGYTGTGFSIRQQAFGAAPNFRRAYSDASSVCGVTPLPTSGDLNVAGIGINVVPAVPCPTPVAQPTGLVLTPISQVQINGSFTAAVPPATNYLVVRYPSGAVPVNPVNGTNYVIGAALGTGTVVSNTNATTFSATGLSPATTYHFYVYSFNTGSCGTAYLTAAPLFGSATTPPCTGPPTLTCPSNVIANTDPGQCGAIVTYPPAVAGGSPAPVITYSQASGTFFPLGTTTITVTATSICGTTSCTFTVTVNDTQAPTITCPANITVPNDPNVCSAVVNYPLPSVRDNCPPPVQIPASFANHGSGGVFTLQGNTMPGGVFFSITNTTGVARSIYGFGIRFGNPAFGLVTAPQTLTVWSRPGFLTSAIENSTAGWTQQGPQVVNPIPPYFATGTGPLGFCGLNTNVLIAPGATASFFIHGETACPVFNGTVGAITPPVSNGGFTLTGGTVSYGVLGSANHFQQGVTNVIANINVQYTQGLTLIQTVGLPSGSVFPIGVTTNTFQATDAAGNSSTCSFTVTVNDVQQPNITCPANQVRNTDLNQCYATFTPPQPVFSDNCGVTRLIWVMTGATTGSNLGAGINYVPSTQFLLTGTTGVGVTTVTYTAYDAAGNTRTCSFTVTVNDAQIPTINTQPATTFFCVGSNASFTVLATANGGPIAYQWQQWDGSAWVDIAGATSATYTIPNITFANNTGTYRCRLTGRCSVVLTNAATLYVNPLPTVSLVTSIPPALIPGQVLTISSNVNPAGGTYRWFRNNVQLTNPLQQGPALTGLTVDDIGTYRLVYTDLNGCVNTSSDIVVSGQPFDKLWVYPVPNNGSFQVRFYNQPGESATVAVFDSKGARVYERAVNTTTAYTRIDVNLGPAIPDGIYVVELLNAAGKRVGARKIVVKK